MKFRLRQIPPPDFGYRGKWIAPNVALLLAAFSLQAHAATYYLDVNGAAAGSGIIDGGAYTLDSGTTATYTMTAAGTGATTTFANTNNLVLSAGSDAAGLGYAVNMNGPVSIAALTVEEGNVTFGGTSIVTLANTLTINSGASLTTAAGIALNVGGNGLSIVNNSSTAAIFNGAVDSGRQLSVTVSAGDATFNGNLGPTSSFTQPMSLVVNTGGTVTLNYANTFRGAVTVSSGTLLLNNASAAQYCQLDLEGGTLQIGNGVTALNIGTLNGTQNLALVSADDQTVSVNTTSSNVGNNYKSSTYSGVLSGSGSFTKNGASTTQTFTGANTYSGGTYLNSGVLNINNGGSATASAIGTGTLTISGGTIDNTSGSAIQVATNNAQVWNGNFTFTGGSDLDLGTGAVSLGTAAGTVRIITVNGGLLTAGGAVSNGTTATGLTKAGAGALFLSGNASYSGTTTISGGMLAFGGSPSPGNLLLAGGVVGLKGSFTGGFGIGNGQVKWSGNGGFAAYGGDLAVNLGGAGATCKWGATNYFLGSGFALIFGNGRATGTVDFQNGIDFNGATHIVQVDDGSAAVDAKLSGSLSNGGLKKTGAGTLELSGNSNYTGATTVAAGKVIVSGSISASAVTVGDSAIGSTLASLGGTGLVGDVTVGAAASGNTGARLNAGSAAANSTGILTTGALTVQSGAHLTFDIRGLTAGTGYDQIQTSGSVMLLGADLELNLGTLSIGDGVYYLVVNGGGGAVGGDGVFASLGGADVSSLADGQSLAQGGHFFVGTQEFVISYTADSATGMFEGVGNDIALMAVPEPSTWATLFGGFSLLSLWHWKRRRA